MLKKIKITLFNFSSLWQNIFKNVTGEGFYAIIKIWTWVLLFKKQKYESCAKN